MPKLQNCRAPRDRTPCVLVLRAPSCRRTSTTGCVAFTGTMQQREKEPDRPLISRCAWCARVCRDGVYVDSAPSDDEQYTHTICPDCLPLAFPELYEEPGPSE